jgi:hypothetical protein
MVCPLDRPDQASGRTAISVLPERPIWVDVVAGHADQAEEAIGPDKQKDNAPEAVCP